MANLIINRCEKLLNKPIYLIKSDSKYYYNKLTYNIDRLKKEDIEFDVDHNQEIDDLINFCLKHFKN